MSQASPLVLATGATDGIGLETALELARRGANVILHGRDARKLEKTRALVESQRAAASAVAKERAEPAPEVARADFASLDEVRALASDLEKRGVRPTVLLNNAGIFARKREKSRDGFELTFAVNHLAPFLLTHLLLEGRAGEKLERIVNVSSVAHGSGRIELADPDGAKAPYEGYAAYSASKLANVLFTVELARRLAPRKVDVNALHPGVVSTKLLKAGFGMGGPDSLEEGAATSVFLALDPSVRGTTGRYFVRSREAQASSHARDAKLCREFYELSCKLSGARPVV